MTAHKQSYTTGVVSTFSIEEHRAVASELWDVELEPLARGPFSSKTVFLTTPRMAMYHESWNRPMRVRGSLRSGQVAFALPTAHGLPFQMSGRAARAGRIPWLSDSRRCDLASEAAYENLLVVLDTEFLREIAARLRHPAAEAAFVANAPRMLRAKRDKAVALRQRAERLLAGVEQRSAGRIARETRSARLDERVAEALLDTFDIKDVTWSRTARSPSNKERCRMVATCLEYARARRFDVTIAALCCLIGKSRRFLEYAFREITGTSPARYLRLCRLREVRLELMAARREEKTVTDLATRWGFFELGRFAAEYRRVFGELPSESLRRTSQTKVSIPALKLGIRAKQTPRSAVSTF